MKHAQKNAHVYLLAVVVSTLLSIVLFACISANKAATIGGAIAGAAGGGALGGPAGAVMGAGAGAAGGDALVDDPPTTSVVNNTNIEAQPGSTINVANSKKEPSAWYDNAWLWLWVALIWRFRHGVIAFFHMMFTGGFKAAFMTLIGVLWGGAASNKAKAMVATRRKKSPIGAVSGQKQVPHAP